MNGRLHLGQGDPRRGHLNTERLTGDNELVTAKICREVGLDFDEILLGSDVEIMDDAGLARAVEAHEIARINAGAYSFEAGNPRHEHEWQVWEEVKLPEGKALIPGVITHGSNFVEHPEAIAQRIGRFAQAVGRENVIAGADCGFASFSTTCEVHPTIVWAKLASLAEGARLASKEFWGRA